MMRGLATAVLALCAYGAHAIPLRHITSRKGVPLGDEQPELAFRIVGGAGVEKPVPYMAQVFNKVADNETVQCGGTLISPTQVSFQVNIDWFGSRSTLEVQTARSCYCSVS